MEKTFLIFYLLIAGGYILKVLGIFKKEDTAVFVNYVLYFALPIAILGTIHDFQFQFKDFLTFGIAWIVVLITYIGIYHFYGKKFKLEEKSRKTLFLSSSFGNTAFVGYPLAYTLFGDKGLAYAILYDVLGNFIMLITLALYTITGKLYIRLIYQFPPLGAFLLALLLKPFSLAFLKPFITAVKASITPTALFSIGLRLEPQKALKNVPNALIAVFWRQIVIPSIVFLILLGLKEIYPFPKVQLAITLLQSSMPPFVMAIILSEKYKLNTDLAIVAANLGLMALPLTLPLWLFLLNLL